VYGLAEEVGEVIGPLKKWRFHGHSLPDHDKLTNEVGDVLYYLVVLCHELGISPEEAMVKNVEKLKVRYPDGFSVADSLNRKDLIK
jgi:NTP pyrophosphatase (non-canonical NTP hydrolase)